MADSYVKVWASILSSSIWSEDKATRIVWITFLVMADRQGFVGASVDGIARMANVSVEEAEAAIEVLESPDPRSRSKEDDGRRIVPVERGWHVINHSYFRDLVDKETQREYERARKATYRARLRGDQCPGKVPGKSLSASASARLHDIHGMDDDPYREQKDDE